MLRRVGNVRFEEPQGTRISVRNTGDVPATVKFLNFPGTDRICPSWIHVSPVECTVDVGESQDIAITIMIDNAESSIDVYGQKGTIDEVLVLHVEGGRDFFVRVEGTYEITCFGLSLENQLNLEKPVRVVEDSSLIDVTTVLRSVPYALHELTVWLLQDGRLKDSNLLQDQEDGSGVGGISAIRDSLDEGQPLHPDTVPGEVIATLGHWRELLPQPLIPTTVLYRWGNGGKGFIEQAASFLEQELPARFLHVNVYIVSLLREMVGQRL